MMMLIIAAIMLQTLILLRQCIRIILLMVISVMLGSLIMMSTLRMNVLTRLLITARETHSPSFENGMSFSPAFRFLRKASGDTGLSAIEPKKVPEADTTLYWPTWTDYE
jgi:hypothetical protein